MEISEKVWYARCLRDLGKDWVASRETPIPWYMFFLGKLQLDEHRGLQFATKVVKTIFQLLEDSMTSLQELVLSGDVETTRYQIGREQDKTESKFELAQQNSLLQYAVLTGTNLTKSPMSLGQESMIQMLLEESEKEFKRKYPEENQNAIQKRVLDSLNKGDLVTGFTAFHYAIFTENRKMMSLLIQRGASVDKKDNFFGTAFDYARMLAMLSPRLKPPTSIQVWNESTLQVEALPVSKLEKMLDITFQCEILCDHDYIFELMFSGFCISEPDMKFREIYLPPMYASSGDEHLVLAEISGNVGFGVFAAKDFKEGDYIVRYAGKLTAQDRIKDKSYNMACGVEGIGLDGKFFRNLGGMINHCSNANAESQCVFDRGAEQAIITAKRAISKGEQILLDYSKNYWTKKALRSLTLEDLSNSKCLKIG